MKVATPPIKHLIPSSKNPAVRNELHLDEPLAKEVP